MSDFINSLKAILYDRAVSPLFGTFAVAWALCNYKFIVVLLTTMEVDAKFIYIDKILYPDFLWAAVKLIVMPTIGTLAAIFVYPRLAKPVFEHVSEEKAALRKIKQKNDDSILDDKLRRLQRLLTDQRIEHDKALDVRDEEVTRLKNIVEQLTKSNSDINEALRVAEEASVPVPSQGKDKPRKTANSSILSPSQEQILQNIGEKEAISVIELEDGGDNKIKRQYDLEVLTTNGYLDHTAVRVNNSNISGYRLSSRGRAHLVENGLVG